MDNTALVLYAYNSMYRCEETNKTCMHMYKYNSMYRCGKTNKTCMHMYNSIHVHVWRHKQNLYAHVKQYVHVMCGETKLVKLKVVCTYIHVQQHIQVWGNKTCMHMYNSMYSAGKQICTCTTVCTGVGKQNLFAFVHQCTGVGRWLHMMLTFHVTLGEPRVLAEKC